MALPSAPTAPRTSDLGNVPAVEPPVTAGMRNESPPVASHGARLAGAAPAARALHVRVRQRLGNRRSHYVGALHMEGEPSGPRDLHLDSSAPIEVKAADGTPVVFTAPAFAPQPWVPPEPCDPDFVHDIVLEPASAMRFHFVGLPNDEACAVDVHMQTENRSVAVQQDVEPTHPDGCSVAFPGGADVRWVATYIRGPCFLRVAGTALALGLAETRDVVVDFAAVALQTNWLVGPSPTLLPHLEVQWLASTGGRLHSLVVDRDGSFRRPTSEVAGVSVCTIDDGVQTVAQPAGDVVRWIVPEPLVGVQVVGDDGTVATTEVVNENGRVRGFAGGTHVFRRRDLPPILALHVSGELLTFPTSTLPVDSDLLVLRPGDAQRPTLLLVQVEGAPPEPAVRKALSLCVRSDGDGDPMQQTQPAEPETRLVLMRGGRYSVCWRCGNQDGPVVDRVTVAKGQQQALHTSWPTVHEWTGEVQGYSELPHEQRWHKVGFGPGESVISGWWLQLDAKGHFRGLRLAGDPPAGPAFLGWGLCRVEAEIVRRDEQRHHLVVQPSASMRWVDVVVDAPEPWRVEVMRRKRSGWPSFVHAVTKDQRWPIPVVGDEALLLALVAPESESTQVLAWATLPPQQATVLLRPTTTRRLEIRAGSFAGERSFSLVGPAGQVGGQHTLRSGGVMQLDVPFDTRGLVPWSGEAQQPPAEIPLGGRDIVVID